MNLLRTNGILAQELKDTQSQLSAATAEKTGFADAVTTLLKDLQQVQQQLGDANKLLQEQQAAEGRYMCFNNKAEMCAVLQQGGITRLHTAQTLRLLQIRELQNMRQGLIMAMVRFSSSFCQWSFHTTVKSPDLLPYERLDRAMCSAVSGRTPSVCVCVGRYAQRP